LYPIWQKKTRGKKNLRERRTGKAAKKGKIAVILKKMQNFRKKRFGFLG